MSPSLFFGLLARVAHQHLSTHVQSEIEPCHLDTHATLLPRTSPVENISTATSDSSFVMPSSSLIEDVVVRLKG